MKCTENCDCNRHRPTGRSCPSGCTCGRHTAVHGSGWKLTDATRERQAAGMRAHVKSDSHRANLSAAKQGIAPNHTGFTGRTHSPTARAKMSASRRGVAKSPSHTAALTEHLATVRRATSPTKIEDILINVVLAEFPVVEREVRFGRHVVDAYLPAPYHVAFEADGAYWHDADRDQKRDAVLADRFGLPVVRFSEGELLELAA